MQETETIAIEPASSDSGQALNLIDILIILAKRKKLLLGVPLGAALISGAVTFALPDVYRAGTQLLPPQQPQSGAAALLSQLGGAAVAVAGGAGVKNPNDLYIGMLRSRTIADNLIQKYGLQKTYQTHSAEEARRELASNTSISSGKDGLITIEVEDKDRQRVASLANSYVEELLKLTNVLAVTEAAQRRLFFERQLGLAKQNLAAAEASLKGALDSGGIVNVDSESRAVLETIGRLRAEISAKEIQLNSLTAFVTTRNQEYKQVEEELKSLRAQLSRLQNGDSAVAGATGQAGKDGKGLQSVKIMRDVKYHQMLYELLAKQYEAARLDEAKDTPIVQVLDPAIAPERKAKPHRVLATLISGVLGLLVAVALAFLLDAKEKLLLTANGAKQWNVLRSKLRVR